LLSAQAEKNPKDPVAAATVPSTSSRGRRELLILVLLLAFGLFAVPLLIWVVGRGVLGPFADGGPLALLGDFLNGLRTGSLVYWAVAFGPYLMVMVLRGLWHFARAADRDTD
jgi:hypothetical protein